MFEKLNSRFKEVTLSQFKEQPILRKKLCDTRKIMKKCWNVVRIKYDVIHDDLVIAN